MTTNAVAGVAANSKIDRMFGCESLATLIASRSNRAIAVVVVRERLGDDLDGDVAVEPRVSAR